MQDTPSTTVSTDSANASLAIDINSALLKLAQHLPTDMLACDTAAMSVMTRLKELYPQPDFLLKHPDYVNRLYAIADAGSSQLTEQDREFIRDLWAAIEHGDFTSDWDGAEENLCLIAYTNLSQELLATHKKIQGPSFLLENIRLSVQHLLQTSSAPGADVATLMHAFLENGLSSAKAQSSDAGNLSTLSRAYERTAKDWEEVSNAIEDGKNKADITELILNYRNHFAKVLSRFANIRTLLVQNGYEFSDRTP